MYTPGLEKLLYLEMFLGGSAPPGCPSIAESAVTGISQVRLNKGNYNALK